MFEKKNKVVKLSTCKEEIKKDINPEKISIALVYYYPCRRWQKQV
jgi:hypothetical protein